MKNGSPDVRLGEAWKGRPPLGVVAVVSLDQAKTIPLAGDRLFLGLSVGRNDGQWVEPDAGCPEFDGSDA